MTELFDSLRAEDREDLGWMLNYGFTQEVATQLLNDGLRESLTAPVASCPNLPVGMTEPAKRDLDCFGHGEVRAKLNAILSNLRTALNEGRCQSLAGGAGWLLRDGPFRVVFTTVETDPNVLVFAIDPAGINPLQKVWRYFDQLKAEDLLKSSSLYFCRLDQLTNDPREGRLPLVSAGIRTNAFRHEFRDSTPEIIAHNEEILRGSTYVCCWTRRNNESYLAWKHYCSTENGRPGGGIAIQSSWRRISHLHSMLRAQDEQVFCRTVGYERVSS